MTIYGYIRVSTDKQSVENQRFEISKFAEEKNISPINIPVVSSGENVFKIKTRKPKHYLKTQELVAKKIPLDMIAKNQGLTVGTIINHMESLIENEEKLELAYLKIPNERYEDISSAFDSAEVQVAFLPVPELRRDCP